MTTPPKKRRKRLSYREGLWWIAHNDEPFCLEASDIAGQLTTLLLADLFDKDPDDVAEDVIRLRQSLDQPKPAL